nr:hypothetical protein [uncultured Roseovarius sp.]
MTIQIKSGPQSGRSSDPERALWLEVLIRGLEDAAGRAECSASRMLDALVAQRWIGTPDFREVCENAGMDPDFIQEAYRRGAFAEPIKKRGRKTGASAGVAI